MSQVQVSSYVWWWQEHAEDFPLNVKCVINQSVKRNMRASGIKFKYIALICRGEVYFKPKRPFIQRKNWRTKAMSFKTQYQTIFEHINSCLPCYAAPSGRADISPKAVGTKKGLQQHWVDRLSAFL